MRGRGRFGRCSRRLAIAFYCFSLLFAHLAFAEDPPAPPTTADTADPPAAAEPPKTLPPAQFKEREQLDRDSNRAFAEGRIAEAISTGEKMLAIELAGLGGDHEEVDNSRQWLAELYAIAGKLDDAGTIAAKSLTVQQRLHGEKHWRATSAKLMADFVDQMSKLDSDQRATVKQAAIDYRLAHRLFRDGKPSQAIVPAQKSLDARRKALGEEAFWTGRSWLIVGYLQQALKKSTDSATSLGQAAKIFEKTAGPKHPELAEAYDGLANTQLALEQFDPATKSMRLAWTIRQDALGAKHNGTLTALGSLVVLQNQNATRAEQRDDLPGAQKIRDEVLTLQQQRFAADDWRVADARAAIERGKKFAALKPDQRKKLIEAQAQQQKSFALYLQDKNAEGLTGAEQVLETRRTILGAEHIDTVAAMNLVGLLANDLKDYARAETMFTQATELWRAALGEAHPDYSRGLFNLAGVREQQGRYDDAAKLFRQALAIREAALGEQDSDTQLALQRLASATESAAFQKQNSGDFAGAQTAWAEAVKLHALRYGDKHWRTDNVRLSAKISDQLSKVTPDERKRLNEAYSQINTVMQLSTQERYQDALPLASKSLATRQALLGPDHRDTINSMYWVGEMQLKQKEYSQAEKMFKDVEVQRKKLYGEEHPVYLSSLDNLARVYFPQNKMLPASQAMRRALTIRRRVFGDADSETVRTVNWLLEDLRKLAEQFAAAGDYPGAIRVRQEILDVSRDNRGPEAWETREAQYRLKYDNRMAELSDDERKRLASAQERLKECETLAGQTKFLEALAKAQEASQIYQEILGDGSVESVVAGNWLAQMYARQGDFRTAEKVLLRNQEILATELGKTHHDYAYALHNLANAYYGRNEFAKACPIYREAWQVRAASQGETHRDTLNCSQALQTCLERVAAGQEKKADFVNAKKSRQEVLALRTTQFGDKHWQVNDAKWAAYQTDQLAAMRPYDRERLAEADKLVYNSHYWSQQRADQARFSDADPQKLLGLSQAILKAAGEAVQIRRQLLRENHPAVAEALDLLAEAQSQTGDFANAKTNLEKSLAIRKATQGDKHPNYVATSDRLTAAVTDSMALAFQRPTNLTPAQQQRIAQRDRLDDESLRYRKAGDRESEMYALEQMLEIERSLYGENHEEVASTYQRMMWNSVAELDGDSAHDYANRILQIHAKLYGATSWQANESRYQLAMVDRMRQFDENQWQRYLTAYQNGGKHEVLIPASGDQTKGREEYELLRRKAEQSRAIIRELFGENSLYYANILEGLISFYPGQAEALRRQAAEISARLLGNDHPMYLLRLNAIAAAYSDEASNLENSGKYAEAKQVWEKRVGIQLLHYGPQHWQVTKARGQVSHCQKLSTLSKADRERLGSANATMYESMQQRYSDSDGELISFGSEKEYREAAETFRQVLGAEDLSTIRMVTKLGGFLRGKQRYREAIDVLQPAVAAAQRVWLRENPLCIEMCNELGMSYYALGDFVQTETYLRQCREALESSGRVRDNRYANCLNSLAVLYAAMGDYDRAEPLLKQVVQVNLPSSELPVDTDPDEDYYRVAAGKYKTLMGEFSLSVVIFDGTVGARPEPTLPPREVASFVNNLGLLHLARKDYKQAESILRQSLSFYHTDSNGKRPEKYYDGLCNLASVYESQGDLERAESLMNSVIQQKRKEGASGAKFAVVLNNLGTIRFRRGDLDGAGELWAEAAQIRFKELGVRHPNSIMSQANLALLADRRGQSQVAAAGLEKALDQTTTNLHLAASIQSERQQLITANILRGYLDQYLSMAFRRQLPAENVYRHVLVWKGAVLARQRWMRALQQAAGAAKGNAKGNEIVAELAEINNRLSSITFGGLGYGDGDKLAELDKLAIRKDDLERQLSRASAELGANLQAVKLNPAALQAMLPPKTALVDLIEYTQTTWPSAGQSEIGRERRVAAFVIVPGKPIIQQDLGSAAAIEKLVDACREQWLKRKRPTGTDPGVELRKLLWDPLVPALAEIDTVLISPDGASARFPFAALPGQEPDSYLIDKWAIAIVPVPQLLGDILAKPDAAAAAPATPTMLLVGDVDFGAAPGGTRQTSRGAKSPRGDKPAKFDELPGTRTEIEALQRLYMGKFKTKGVTLLDGARATESEVRHQASQCRVMHLATHGFFAPPEIKPAAIADANPYTEDPKSAGDVAGWNPGLLSGVVLAGVNQPVSIDRDDGILTAAEVSELNLSQTQLVVLSACETGLGQIAGGEGALGLQRAFQVAGARSVVSSLWKVDDEATQLLMTQFYENLWKKGLSPLAAFRQAQLSLLNGKVDISKLRGIDIDEVEGAEQQSKRLSPRLWAAFVLSGSPN